MPGASYFSFAQDFLNNTISIRNLSVAMRLGQLGEQVVLISEAAFDRIAFLGYEMADHRIWHYRRLERDRAARAAYQGRKKSLEELNGDLFVLDLIREEIKDDDPRLRPNLLG